MQVSLKQRLGAFAAAGALALAMAPMAAMGLTADTNITVTGIDGGDSASYYQVIRQNSSTKAWELVSPFTSLGLADLSGNATLKTAHPTWTDLDYIMDGISAQEAGVIAAKASGAGTAMTESTTTAGSFSATVDPGMYLVLATPAETNKDVVYKPMFVSADYDQSADSPNSLAANTEVLATAVAKKSPLTLEKTASTTDNKPNGVAVGDVVTFTVKTNVPSYTTNFTDPVFTITDELSTGLQLNTGTITVAVANNTVTANTDYTIRETGTTGYVVTFKKSFLNTVTGNPEVTITYTATVTSSADKQVNEMDNTATLNFSNSPSDESGQGEIKDKTRHYTFDIDGALFGNGSGSTKEVEKVGVTANGETDTTISSSSYPDDLSTGTTALAGATFELRTAANDATTAIKFKSGVKSSESDASATITSNSDGSIVMKGLDEGTYFLVETSAPAGYSFDPAALEVVIAATYVDDADGNKVLSEYTITIDGHESKYTVGTDNAGKPIELTNSGASITAETTNLTTLIVNKQLGLLPSTGGSGILFYVGVGAAIMALAIALSRRNRKVNGSVSGATA